MSTPSIASKPSPAVRSIGAHLTALGLSAMLLALAFPMPGWWFLAYVALVPMAWLALKTESPRRLLWTSYLIGTLWWLGMVRWLIPVTWPGYVAMCLILGGYWPLALTLFRGMVRQLKFPAMLALPLAWVSVEMVRGHFIAGGFGWFTLGQSQAPWQPGQGATLIQFAAWGGELTVSLLVAAGNGFILDTLHAQWLRRAWRRPLKMGLICFILLLVLVWSVGLFHAILGGSKTKSLLLPVSIALVQTNVPQDNKNHPTPETEAKNWRELLDLTRQAAHLEPKPALIVWPETVSPAPLDADSLRYYQPRDSRWLSSAQVDAQIAALARELDVAILVGGHAWNWKPETRPDGTYVKVSGQHNSVFLYTPRRGQAPQRYDKVHLVPFGEYIPYVDAVPWLKEAFFKYLSPYGAGNDYSLTAGRAWTVFEVDIPHPSGGGVSGRALRLVTPICFEDTIAQVCRSMIYAPGGSPRADVLVNLTNDGWYPNSSQPWLHLQIATLRCAELGVPMLRAVNTGVSAAIDGGGEITGIIAPGRAGVMVATLRDLPMIRPTLYGRLGDGPMWTLTAVTGLLGITAWFKSRRNKPAAKPTVAQAK